ncbi:Prokaryotic diacylglycerol kinase [Prochlorococcus marinus str. MIT 9515]|uniref:Prokaryotic diacylglycerol kinase n=1 Tax=Prochlorococcus marinus (strain MIT 9515) TaxID=167542 RepID=A2BUG0_PROM5|nr:diacylglycerol kinase family protein [Prochlorococcus marinus]ABM71421.1 Prokaryotic diacylglycerol kinase [Prochlorococcus marinus str. MIT 9515]
MKSKAKLSKNIRESYRISRNVFISFRYAFNGIKYTFRNSRNFQIQVIFALFSALLGSILQINKTDYLILLLTVFSVLALEILNTSIESLVDLVVKKKFSNLAKIAKDCSAGAVLLASINSVIIGLSLFIPKIKLLF